MPSLSKIASFHSVSQSPRHKTGWYGSTPDIRPDPDRHGGGGADPRLQPPGGGVGAAGNHNYNHHHHHHQPASGQSTAVSSAAVPTLPDVQLSRAQFTQQWSFLHALLAQDEAERLDDSRVIEVSEPRDGSNDSAGNNDTAAAAAAVTDFSGSGRRSVVVTAEGAERREVCRQGDGLVTLDGETTDRSGSKRAAHLSSNAAAALSASKSGHRVSRRSGRLSGRLTGSSPTPRQGPHGSVSARMPMEYSKRRPSPSGGDANQSVFRKPSSPATATATRASISAENTARTYKHSEEKSSGSGGQTQRKSSGSAAVVTHGDQAATQAYRPKSPGVTPDTTLPPSSLTSVSSRAGAAGTRKLSGAAAAAAGTGAGDKTPAAASHLVNQWTTCRALEDLGDDEAGSDTAEKTDDEFLGQPNKLSDTWSQQEVPRVGAGEAALRGGAADGVFSRAASSTNLARRKRPLLLPPIMLPPIYTVKPTPLRLRDEVCFMGASPRARRQISDEEWENLKDCRYLRIRTVKRSLRV